MFFSLSLYGKIENILLYLRKYALFTQLTVFQRMNKLSRREMLKAGGALAATLAVTGSQAFAADATASERVKSGKRKIMIIGAHPDDPETGCGGTMIRLAKAGHEVISVYFTRGERGIPGTGLDESARIRTTEAIEACRLLGVRPVFMTQIDGDSEITQERYNEMHKLIEDYKPDIVFAHWPIDSHRDHANCSNLVFDAWIKMDKPFELYYFEVCSGIQTMQFYPTDFVDITSVVELKRKACFCHVSQGPERWYEKEHGRMEEFRGMQSDVEYAEAFVKFQKSSCDLQKLLD